LNISNIEEDDKDDYFHKKSDAPYHKSLSDINKFLIVIMGLIGCSSIFEGQSYLNNKK
jgi:hypothetical protein